MNKRKDILDKTWDILDKWEDKEPPKRLKRSIMKSVRPERSYLPFSLSPAYGMLIIIVLIIIGTFYVKFEFTKEYNKKVPDTKIASQEESVEITSADIIAKLEMIENIEILQVLDKLENMDKIPVAHEDDQSREILMSGNV